MWVDLLYIIWVYVIYVGKEVNVNYYGLINY